MTTWTNPRTWTIGELVTKAIMDTHVRDNLLHLKEQTEAAIEQAVFFTTPKGNVSYAGGAKNTGTYTIAANTFHVDLPNAARAIYVTLTASWAAASSGSYVNVVPGGFSNNCLIVRSQVAGFVQDNTGVVPLNSSGEFSIIVGGANAAALTIEVWGYIL